MVGETAPIQYPLLHSKSLLTNQIITNNRVKTNGEQPNLVRIRIISNLGIGGKLNKQRMEFPAGVKLMILRIKNPIKDGANLLNRTRPAFQAGVINLIRSPRTNPDKSEKPSSKSPRRKQFT
jgi:hypothetical protein